MARRQDGSIQSWNGKALHRTGIWLAGWLWLGMNTLPAVVLTEIGIPDSGAQPYIELMNPGAGAIDLGGWLIQGDDSFRGRTTRGPSTSRRRPGAACR